MMEQLLILLLNMSLTASYMILAVLVLRLLLRRAPRIFSYGLWAVVLFRLLCPVSFSAPVSFLGMLKAPVGVQGQIEYIPENIGYMGQPAVELPIPAMEEAINQSLPAATPMSSINPMQVYLFIGGWIWLVGAGAMALYGLGSLLLLKRRLRGALEESRGIYRTDMTTTPFVLGLFRYGIYLPRDMEEERLPYVLLHERTHIRRGDPMIRIAAYLALCLHWFNPLVWVAFFVSGRDMEMSCDEAVIRKMGNSVKKEYSQSLLAMAVGRSRVRGIPLAFGEGDTGSRIRHVLSYRRPGVAILGLAALGCGIAAVLLLANPGKKQEAVTFYGVLSELDMEEAADTRLVVTIPGQGEVQIPEAGEISPYIEMDFNGLEAGHLVRITFSGEEEVLIQETYPASFSARAEEIQVMGLGFSLENAGNGFWRLAIPRGMSPQAQALEILEIYHHDPAIDGQPAELLTATPVLEVEEACLWVELSSEETRTFLAEFGFGITCLATGQKGTPADAQELEQNRGGEVGESSGELTTPSGEVPGAELLEPSVMELSREQIQAGRIEDGTYRVYIRSLSRSGRGIDRYLVEDLEEGAELPFLAFAPDCVFLANEEMDTLRYEKVSFDTFAELAQEGLAYLLVPLGLTFENGQVVEATLESSFYGSGISYAPVLADNWYEFLLEEVGTDVLEKFYSLTDAQKLDVADRDGEEELETYTGNIGDGDSGLVLIKGEDGQLLYTLSAHASRAGWNNIYAGTLEGSGYLMTVHVEDRDDFGSYGYYVFRLGEEGEIRQIAGATFTYGDHVPYQDSLFRKWAERLKLYLENSYLLLSTQEGELRTEHVSEADRYSYETLHR
ncbi:MAG: hypothetical protein HFI33_03055 [Lachnospiraceae bacterium]|nr:hypothetical protein [Lachnospiraceae bacterium]